MSKEKGTNVDEEERIVSEVLSGPTKTFYVMCETKHWPSARHGFGGPYFQ